MLLMLLSGGGSGPTPVTGRLIELSTAKAHLRVEDEYPDEQIEGKLYAAEESAMQFLNRRVFKTKAALAAAVALVPTNLGAASAAYAAAKTAAELVDDHVTRCMALEHAEEQYSQAQAEARETYKGIVINDQIAAGMLLILGHLFENRQDVVTDTTAAEMPLASKHLLHPFRVGLGV